METSTFTMPAEQARLKFEEYRESLKRRYNDTDDELMRAFKALSEGTPVLDLVETMKLGGLDEDGHPKLAIIRGDAKVCWFYAVSRGGWFTTTRTQRYPGYSTSGIHSVAIPPDTFSRPVYGHVQAQVPHIPPSLRPKILGGYHILWEAIWEPEPPIDPYLVKRLGPPGSMLYAVLAQWDLTELERAVLRRHLA